MVSSFSLARNAQESLGQLKRWGCMRLVHMMRARKIKTQIQFLKNSNSHAQNAQKPSNQPLKWGNTWQSSTFWMLICGNNRRAKQRGNPYHNLLKMIPRKQLNHHYWNRAGPERTEVGESAPSRLEDSPRPGRTKCELYETLQDLIMGAGKKHQSTRRAS